MKKIFVMIFLILSLSFFSLPSASEHAKAGLEDFGFYTGKNKNIRLTFTEISNLIDNINSNPFKDISTKFGKFGHRNFGHWGFSGSIPFNKNEYLKELIKNGVSKEKIVLEWKKITDKMTNIVMEKTGVTDKKLAKSLAGLIYDHHILKDYEDKIIEPLSDINNLKKDILKNFETLFGKNSNLTTDFRKYLKDIPKNLSEKEQSILITKFIKKVNLGSSLEDIFSKEFQEKNIKVYTNLKKMMNSSNKINKYLNIKTAAKGALLSGIISGLFHSYKVYKNEEEIDEALKNVIKDSSKTGISLYTSEAIMQKIGKKYALTAATGAALNYGIATFVFNEVNTVYDFFIDKSINSEEFLKENGENILKSSFSGLFSYCAVILGATPTGFTVIAVAIAGDLIINKAIETYKRLDKKNYFFMEDIIGNLPLSVQRRRTIFDLEDHYKNKKTIFDLEDHYKDKKTIFDLEDHYKDKKTIFDLEEHYKDKKTIFDY
ncbi:hypothetical protein OSSY52_02050 [Tepiditoga spiralis]|uniref:Uncharacterized protein n=1 Tax=Tepiditoga spiralis TaxID=2108365 RepID=A0A7G1G4W8_9BACT|nr:hypothetical protein [Tepiditoga spiralis]BBE30064.1 hypothetical protein OSSY52_02050 [Tepiditoga spiralis]